MKKKNGREIAYDGLRKIGLLKEYPTFESFDTRNNCERGEYEEEIKIEEEKKSTRQQNELL